MRQQPLAAERFSSRQVRIGAFYPVKKQYNPLLRSGLYFVAASPNDGDGKYDAPEPNKWDKYQDFGHTHWHNSLIWGENLENISILGPGLIWGKGLVRGGNQSRTKEQNDALKDFKPISRPLRSDTGIVTSTYCSSDVNGERPPPPPINPLAPPPPNLRRSTFFILL